VRQIAPYGCSRSSGAINRTLLPQAGFEPAPLRFLRPPPLPLGYCGESDNRCDESHPTNRKPQIENVRNALGRIRTCTWRDSRSRASAEVGLPELSGVRRELNPHLLGASQASSQLDDGPDCQCCGKGSNLQPRPSEGRALIPIELPQHHFVVR
jgi:hypothetical protein